MSWFHNNQSVSIPDLLGSGYDPTKAASTSPTQAVGTDAQGNLIVNQGPPTTQAGQYSPGQQHQLPPILQALLSAMLTSPKMGQGGVSNPGAPTQSRQPTSLWQGISQLDKGQ